MTAAIENSRIIANAMEGLSRGDNAAFGAAMAEDFVWRGMAHGVWGKVYRGRETARRELFAKLWSQYEGRYTNTPSSIYADGDHVIVESRGHATMKNGGTYQQFYCLVIRMEGGQMKEVREYLDTAHADSVFDASVFTGGEAA